MEAKNAQQAAQSRKIRVDHAFEVWHTAESPILEIVLVENTHPHEHLEWGDDLAAREDCGNRPLDAREHRILAEVVDGIEYNERQDCFVWQVRLVPTARYVRLDDVLWRELQTRQTNDARPGRAHEDRTNTLTFVQREPNADLTLDIACEDVRTTLDFLMTVDAALAEAVGLDAAADEEVAATAG
jgi:hypothetical protein